MGPVERTAPCASSPIAPATPSRSHTCPVGGWVGGWVLLTLGATSSCTLHNWLLAEVGSPCRVPHHKLTSHHGYPCQPSAGCRLVSESEERGDLPDPADGPGGAGLDNGQPYPLPPQVGWRS